MNYKTGYLLYIDSTGGTLSEGTPQINVDNANALGEITSIFVHIKHRVLLKM